MDLERSIAEIQERNARVEADKAWEMSWTRTLLIAAMIYVTASIFLWNMYAPAYLFQALIPAGGWIFSTLSLPWFKKWWIARRSAHSWNGK
ncbi:hypothetical protein HYZ99_01010 [Candidatus Peregrinibacteria bacterium]|nr:hypothetical protein [Candidatus Peregrinibacteria bacterium]